MLDSLTFVIVFPHVDNRNSVLSLTIARTFEYFILLTIASNCIVLTLDKPLPNGDTTELNKNLVSRIKLSYINVKCGNSSIVSISELLGKLDNIIP